MIFGFNTDVSTGEVTYHVQSEAREADLLLQTQVFLRGQCIGKRASSYAERTLLPEFSKEQMQEWLRQQHKAVIECVREGRIEDAVTPEVMDINGQGLALRWVNAETVFTDSPLVVSLVVTEHGVPADGALVTCRIGMDVGAPIHTQTLTDAAGAAEIVIHLDQAPSSRELPVLVRAAVEEKSSTRKLRLRLDV